jgi:phospholipase/carboxylesterase
MNRIESATEILSSPNVHPTIPASLSTRTMDRIRLRGRELAPHATFAPLHYEPGYAYPLVVWLHGTTGNERQVRRVMPRVSMRNYVSIAPRGTCATPADGDGFCWQQTAEAIEQAETRIFDCVEIASRRFNVHPDRVFLAGMDCGGTMALRTAWNHPGRFAGVATFGGSMPLHGRPLRNVNALRRLPCFVATGRQSGDYPEADVCRDLRLMHAAGCTVALRQYPCGDELTTTMLADFDRWMMALVCPPQA